MIPSTNVSDTVVEPYNVVLSFHQVVESTIECMACWLPVMFHDPGCRTLKLTVRELDIPKITEELSTLDSQIRLKLLFSMPDSPVFPETLLD